MKVALLGIAAVLSVAQAFFAQAPKPETDTRVAIGEQHYRVYRGDGTAATMDQLIAAVAAAQVTFVGEYHDDLVAHYLEEQLLRRTWDARLALSLEMFERDVQYILDEYLAGLITEPNLIADGRAWKNYASDYRPLIEFAKEKRMPVIAANAPRRYVNRVGRLGAAALDQIEPEGRRFLPPLPYAKASAAYAAKFALVMKQHQGADNSPLTEAVGRSLEAQSLWDASMAHSIAEFIRKHPKSRIFQVNGSFHTSERLGIVEHLLRYRPKTRVLVVTIVPDASFPAFDASTMKGQGDFVVVTDPAVVSTRAN